MGCRYSYPIAYDDIIVALPHLPTFIDRSVDFLAQASLHLAAQLKNTNIYWVNSRRGPTLSEHWFIVSSLLGLLLAAIENDFSLIYR